MKKISTHASDFYQTVHQTNHGYKVDFVVGVLGVFLTQGLNLLFLNVIFQHIPSLEGWTFQEIAFIYGFSLIPKGLDHLFLTISGR